MRKDTQTTGNFPAYSTVDKAKRFRPPRRRKKSPSDDQNLGDFPVKTSRGGEKRFAPAKP